MKKLTIYIDGGSRGNPGPGAIGIVVCNEKDEEIRSYSEYIGECTNNEAEYRAAITALKKMKQWFGKKLALASDVTLKSDSDLLVKQMKGKYKIENERIQPLFLELWNLSIEYDKLTMRKVARDKNKRADALVNEELDKSARSQNLL